MLIGARAIRGAGSPLYGIDPVTGNHLSVVLDC
jgi:hypothetical protein